MPLPPMPSSPLADLTRVVAALVAAPVQAQRLLDRQWVEDSSRWLAIATHFDDHTPAAWRREMASQLAPTMPARSAVRSFDLTCRLRVQVRRDSGLSLKVHPINLGWAAVYGDRRTSTAEISLTVEAVPLTAPPSASTGLAVATDDFLQPQTSNPTTT